MDPDLDNEFPERPGSALAAAAQATPNAATEICAVRLQSSVSMFPPDWCAGEP